MANKDQPAAASSGHVLDRQTAGQFMQNEQIQRALASVQALALVLARQAAREDDAKEREAAASEIEPNKASDRSMISGGD